MSHVNHDDCARTMRLAGDWAIGALDAAGSAELRAHLAACGHDHAEARGAIALAAAIGWALPAYELPGAALRARLLAAVRPR